MDMKDATAEIVVDGNEVRVSLVIEVTDDVQRGEVLREFLLMFEGAVPVRVVPRPAPLPAETAPPWRPQDRTDGDLADEALEKLKEMLLARLAGPVVPPSDAPPVPAEGGPTLHAAAFGPTDEDRVELTGEQSAAVDKVVSGLPSQAKRPAKKKAPRPQVKRQEEVVAASLSLDEAMELVSKKNLGWLPVDAIRDHAIGVGWETALIPGTQRRHVEGALNRLVIEGKWSKQGDGRKALFRPGTGRRR